MAVSQVQPSARKLVLVVIGLLSLFAIPVWIYQAVKNRIEIRHYEEGASHINAATDLALTDLRTKWFLDGKLGENGAVTYEYANANRLSYWDGLVTAIVLTKTVAPQVMKNPSDLRVQDLASIDDLPVRGEDSVVEIMVPISPKHPASAFRGSLYGVRIGDEHSAVVKKLIATLPQRSGAEQALSPLCTAADSFERSLGVSLSCFVIAGDDVSFRWSESPSGKVIEMSARYASYTIELK